MWGKEEKVKTSNVDTLIGQGTEIRGDVVFSGGLHVDGNVKGNVLAQEDTSAVLTLSDNGSIEGEVRVPNVVINGVVVGDVYSSERAELVQHARITGDVYYNLMEMENGAVVNGRFVHRTDATEPMLSLSEDEEVERQIQAPGT